MVLVGERLDWPAWRLADRALLSELVCAAVAAAAGVCNKRGMAKRIAHNQRCRQDDCGTTR